MIYAENLIKLFKKNKIDFYTGVPDSILKNFSIQLDKLPNKKNIIAANEGSAVSIGIGHYLSTKKVPCIYFQNSGLSNAINPMISIANKSVYSIPLFLVIGWRGSPNKSDEPQHKAKGKITRQILKLLDIDYCILKNEKDFFKVKKLLKKTNKQKCITACLIEKDTFLTKTKKSIKLDKNFILRSEFIETFLKIIPKSSKIISTTGYTSRELMQIRKQKKISNGKDFYMVGGMGHASMVTLGYAMNSTKEVFCLDGDGSVLMHLGSLRTVGYLKNDNYKHVILNNNAHESVGGQTTTADGIDFKKLSKSLGYKKFFLIKKKKKI